MCDKHTHTCFPTFERYLAKKPSSRFPDTIFPPIASRIRSGEKSIWGKQVIAEAEWKMLSPPPFHHRQERVRVPLALMVGCLVHRWARGRPSGGDQGIFFRGWVGGVVFRPSGGGGRFGLKGGNEGGIFAFGGQKIEILLKS